jgi:hypothetical protein
MPMQPDNAASPGFGVAWVSLCAAFVLHVIDEALTDFLSVYNPTVLVLRAQAPWLALPVFSFELWLAGLLLANIVLFLLSPYAFRGAPWMRPLGYVFAGIMILNGVGHVLGTIAGQTVASVRFPRPMPGFYSSPFVIIAAIYLFSRLRRSRAARPHGSSASG